MHFCAYHKIDHDETSFKVKANGRLDSWCIEGRREYNRHNSRRLYAPLKAKVAEAKAEKEQALNKTCTVCELEKPIIQFPERYDRPGKRESRCEACLKAIRTRQSQAYTEENFEKVAATKRAYHAAHPRYNTQSSRNRRARLAETRVETIDESLVRERDKDLCWFCQEFVDPTLAWPDPYSQVIHHLHPVAKKGSTCYANVALAHNRCNGRSSDSYDCVFHEGWTVEVIDHSRAKTIMIEKHYLHRIRNSSHAFGLFDPSHKLWAAVTFSTPSSVRVTRSVCGQDRGVLELSRLWVDDSAPHGAASWFVARALRMLPASLVVSYADTGVTDPRTGRNHSGTVYRALNFHYAGKTQGRFEYQIPGSTRSIPKDTEGAERVEISPKERYWTVTGTRRDKKRLRSICLWPSL